MEGIDLVDALQWPAMAVTLAAAWLEPDTYELYFGEAFDNINAFLAGKPTNIVNAEVLTAKKA